MSAMDAELPRPFTVGYDEESEHYYVFAPKGCVLVNGKAVGVKDRDAYDNVALEDIDPDGPPDYLWAHVTPKASAEGGYEVTFDGEETKAGATWNVRVTRFGKQENDGKSYDICVSAISLGGDGTPLPFQVKYDKTLDGGAGGWLIYLPEMANLVVMNNAALGVSGWSGVEAQSDGWYKLTGISGASATVWLSVSKSGETYSVSLGSSAASGAVASAALAMVSGGGAESEDGESLASVQQLAAGILSFAKPADEDEWDVDDKSIDFVTVTHSSSGGAGGGSGEEEGEEEEEAVPQLEIKGWHDGTPCPSGTLAEILSDESSTEPEECSHCVVIRETDGTLIYRPIGRINSGGGGGGSGGGGTTGYTGSIEVVTDIWYDLSEHKLLKKTRSLTYTDGVLTAADNESIENVTNGDAVPVSGLVTGNS